MKTPAPLVLPLAPDLEQQLDAVLCRGEVRSAEDALLAILPPWCDARRGAQALARHWTSSVAWPSTTLRDLVVAAADGDVGDAGDLVETLRATLPLIGPGETRTHLERVLVEATIVLGWTGPASYGMNLAGLSAATACRKQLAPGDIVVLAVGALAWTCPSALSRHCRIRQDAWIEQIDRRAPGGLSGVRDAAGWLFRLFGSAAIQDSTGISCGPDRETAELLLSLASETVEQRFLQWRDERLAALADTEPLVEALRQASSFGSPSPFSGLREATRIAFLSSRARDLKRNDAARMQATLWAALAGDVEAIEDAVAITLGEALQPGLPPSASARLLAVAVGLLRVGAAGYLSLHSNPEVVGAPPLHSLSNGGAAEIVMRTADVVTGAVRDATWIGGEQHCVTMEDLWSRASSVPAAERVTARTGSEEASTTSRGTGFVVIPSLPEQRTGSGREIERDWRSLAGVPLPLVPVPDLLDVVQRLERELPHMQEVIRAVIADLVGRTDLRFRPVLFVGPPGAGKTHAARRICSLLGLPTVVYPAGGVADASLIGTSRQWATGRASVPLQHIRMSRRANVAVIIDEIEKAGASNTNGRLMDGLLSMLEPSSARLIFDPLLETPVDLSMVNWIATANSLAGIDAPLRDRMRIVEVRNPGTEHLPALLPALVEQYALDRGLTLEWIAPLSPFEIDLVATHWRKGSIRRLIRLVSLLLEARDAQACRH